MVSESFCQSEDLTTFVAPQETFSSTVIELVNRKTQGMGKEFGTTVTVMNFP